MAKTKTAAPAASISTAKQNADALLKGKGKFNSTKRPQRKNATRAETDRAIWIAERATTMKLAKNIYSQRWAEYERVWKMIEEQRPEDEQWRANLPDTYGYAAVKTAQAAYIDSEVVPVFAKNQDDDLMRANDMRDLYTDISKKGGIRFQLYLTRLDAFKLGTGFLFTYFEKDTRINWEIDSFDPETEKITYTRKSIDKFADPKTVRVSPYLVLVDEACRADFRGTARDAILIEIISRDEAKLKYGHLFGGPEQFEERVPSTIVTGSTATADILNTGIATTAADNKGRDVAATTYTFFAPIEFSTDMVEVLHYFCVRPEDSYEILVNGAPAQVKTASWPSPMPWIHKEIPITPVRYALYSGDEFWGQGILEVTRADAKAMREHREMMSDRQRISLFSPAFSDVNDEIDQKLLKLKPLSIIRTRGGVPHQYKVSGITSADLQITESYHASMKRATGIDESMIGSGTDGLAAHRYTATAIQFMRQAAFLRLKDFQFLYKMALTDEILLKLKLFEQYYASPLKQAPHLKDQEGLNEIAVKVKEFSVKTGNVYKKKPVSSSLFTGPIEDIDLDMEALMPLTPAELITKWSQVMRDTIPFVQAGVVDLDIEKMLGGYLAALDVNINKLRKSPEDEAISMADGEHELLAEKNTSQLIFDKILKDGTPSMYLTSAHLKRHQQLLSGDGNIQPGELKNLIAHIKVDTDNYEKLMKEQAAKGADLSALGGGALSDFGAPGTGGGGPKPPSVSMNYKDAPDEIKRQIEEKAGLHSDGGSGDTAHPTKAPRISSANIGKGAPHNAEDRPLLN